MTALIPQRADDDCTLCCIAMATGIAYERVLEVALETRLGYRRHGVPGTASALQVLSALGVRHTRSMAFKMRDDDGLPAAPSAHVLWGRRAIVSVPSLNGFKGWHDVYWDGAHLFDPSPKETYPDTLDGLAVLGFVLFRET
jgi:hypothetical protein